MRTPECAVWCIASSAILTPEQLAARVDGANSIAWLVWHLTRIQDDHVAAVAGRPQRWTADGWLDRFALPFDSGATGYGHSSEEVDAVRVPSGDLLAAYYDVVHEQTIAYVEGLTDADLDTRRRRVLGSARDPRSAARERDLR